MVQPLGKRQIPIQSAIPTPSTHPPTPGGMESRCPSPPLPLKGGPLAGILGATPFGLFCLKCHTKLSSSTIRRHLVQKHPELEGQKLNVAEQVRLGLLLRAQLQMDTRGVGRFLLPGSCRNSAICTSCNCQVADLKNFGRHVKRPGGKCAGATLIPSTSYKTVCGRVVSQQLLDRILQDSQQNQKFGLGPMLSTPSQALPDVSISTNPSAILQEEDISNSIKGLVRDEECPGDYVPLFHRLAPTGGGSFHTSIHHLLSLSTQPSPQEDTALCSILQTAEYWLVNHAGLHCNMVPGNLRAALLVFEGQEVADVVQNTTFTMRQNTDTLVPSLKGLLAFCFRHPSLNLEPFRHEVKCPPCYPQLVQSALIPRILSAIHYQTPNDHSTLPAAVIYCLSQCFFVKGGKLTMRECGRSGSIFATVLHLLRLGVCGHVALLAGPGVDETSQGLVQASRLSRVVNTLCPMIRQLREMKKKKPTPPRDILKANGDVLVKDSFVFRQEIWSVSVPTVLRLLMLALDQLVDGDGWRQVLSVSRPIGVSFQHPCNIFFMEEGGAGHQLDIQPKESLSHFHFDRLTSLVEFVMQGFGCGAVRVEEVWRIGSYSARFRNNSLYYWVKSAKRFSVTKGSREEPVEHKLPPSLSRAILVYRTLASRISDLDGDLFVPQFSNRSVHMEEVVQEIFGIKDTISKLDIRHFWTALTNYMFPGGEDQFNGLMVAEDSIAEQSGHVGATHRQRYSSCREGGPEASYSYYHASLGESPYDNKQSPRICPLMTNASLHKALCALKGPDSQFLDRAQKNMVWFAANASTKHSMVGIACGGGKSMAWILPSVARELQGWEAQLDLVVTPTKFLMEYHVASARACIGPVLSGRGISGLAASDIDPHDAPAPFSQGVPPLILFVTVDALASVFRWHSEKLQHLIDSGKVAHIFIDEAHTLFSDISFRPVYESLPKLAGLGRPIMCLSGSLPIPLVLPLVRYLSLGQDSNLTDINDVRQDDLLGKSVRFRVTTNSYPVNCTCASVIMFLREHPGTACHVICSSKNYVSQVRDSLVGRVKSGKVLAVTSDSTATEQREIARSWHDAKADVLISSTVALMGNENARCRLVVIVGYLFDFASLLQAIGRLRPGQRTPEAKVLVVLPHVDTATQSRNIQKMNQRFGGLVRMGLLEQGDLAAFEAYFGISGLYKFFNQKGVCRWVGMAKVLGQPRDPCGICDQCSVPKPTIPIKEQSRMQQIQNKVEQVLIKKAETVLLKLQDGCPACGKGACDGERCMTGCYACGGRHPISKCKMDRPAIMQGMGCYYCYDLYQRVGAHNANGCRIKRRLRRAVVQHCQRVAHPGGVKAFLEDMFASHNNWYKSVAQLSPR